MLNFDDIFNDFKPSAETNLTSSPKGQPLRIDTSSLFQHHQQQQQQQNHHLQAPPATSTGHPTFSLSSPRANYESPLFEHQMQMFQVTDAAGNPIQVNLNARMEGGFFQAEEKWTCYRRNFFRVSCVLNAVTATGDMISAHSKTDQFLHMPDGARVRINGYRVSLSAICNHGKPVDLVAAKKSPSGKPAGIGAELAVVDLVPSGNLSLAPRTPSPQAVDSTLAVFDKLQFRSATSNNGKRKAIQQYFRLKLDLWAVCENGCALRLLEATGDDVVVRGRSPGHYADLERIKERRTSVHHDRNARRSSWNGLPDQGQAHHAGLVSAPVIMHPSINEHGMYCVNGVPVPVSPATHSSFWSGQPSSRPIYNVSAQSSTASHGEHLRNALESSNSSISSFQNNGAMVSTTNLSQIPTSVVGVGAMVEVPWALPSDKFDYLSVADESQELTPVGSGSAGSVAGEQLNSGTLMTDEEFMANFNFIAASQTQSQQNTWDQC